MLYVHDTDSLFQQFVAGRGLWIGLFEGPVQTRLKYQALETDDAHATVIHLGKMRPGGPHQLAPDPAVPPIIQDVQRLHFALGQPMRKLASP